jgi:hypothetical protein
MRWHCGILDDRDPYEPHPTLDWIRHSKWSNPAFPADIKHELAILLATPGFSTSYLCHNLRISEPLLTKGRRLLPQYEELWREVGENWKSITRDEAVKLCHLRPGTGNIPLVCQMAMITDLKSDRSIADIGREYGVTAVTITGLRDRGFRPGVRPLPRGFEMLLQTV